MVIRRYCLKLCLLLNCIKLVSLLSKFLRPTCRRCSKVHVLLSILKIRSNSTDYSYHFHVLLAF